MEGTSERHRFRGPVDGRAVARVHRPLGDRCAAARARGSPRAACRRREGGAGIWYRHIRRVGPSRENEGEALAIIDHAGHAFVVPMAHNHVMQAHWLLSTLMEWAERSRDRAGAWCADGDDGSLAELVDEGRGLRATRSRPRS